MRGASSRRAAPLDWGPMPEKTARAVGRGCLFQLSVALVAVVGLCVVFGLALAVGWLVPLPDPDWRPYVMAGALGMGFVGVLVATLVVSVAAVWRRSMFLDEAFAAVALDGHMYLQNGRQYHGHWGGRRVDAYFYRGPTLDLYVESPLYTRVGIANRSAATVVARTILDKELVPCEAPGFEELEVHPHELAWAEALLADERALELIPPLARDDLGPERRALILGPESVQLKMRYLPLEDITPDNVYAWVEGLSELARVAEELPEPEEHLEESPMERIARLERGRIAQRVAWIALAVFAVIFAAGLIGIPVFVWFRLAG